ncbi:PREDICTED: uncharacterized protein LOC105965760 [Erythranthe guttata]|uniref:uncharacterized protein LOC105965760 n=1 Tax=Erythranthe guttata TaxID=4155 RepID=UPI00064D77AE|nr:PREDICTED: uncharacterized protein LOC105965760 [Erythranthe guttata]|eukprot:XP_012845778.1 PREDICTED: uncharacterized protein LOC105965760 [Erythranthe guttata]
MSQWKFWLIWSLVGGIPLGPDAMKVLVDILIKPDAFLWRPTINMSLIQHAQDKIIAWPAESVILQVQQESNERDNVSPNSSNSRNKCKLIDWRRGKDELVAEGRLHSDDPNALINDIPLGPNAMIVWVDVPKSPEACLWRPTSHMSLITHAINSTIAWPADKVIMESNSESEGNTLQEKVASGTNICGW